MAASNDASRAATRAVDGWMYFDSAETAQHRTARLAVLFAPGTHLPDDVPTPDQVPAGQTWRTAATLRYVDTSTYTDTAATFVVGVTWDWVKYASDSSSASGRVVADMLVSVALRDGRWVATAISHT